MSAYTFTAPSAVSETLTCEECGREFPYGGRGRRPKMCPEHRRKTSDKAPASEGGSKLAATAAKVCANTWAQLGTAAFLMGMTGTAGVVSRKLDMYEDQCRMALESDPDMCRMILKNGTSSGRVAFAITNAMMAFSVVSTGVVELRAIRAAKDAQNEGEDQDQDQGVPLVVNGEVAA